MVRIVLNLCLVLALVFAPSLCCCTARLFAAAPQAPVKKSCCYCEKKTEPVKAPTPPPCKCKAKSAEFSACTDGDAIPAPADFEWSWFANHFNARLVTIIPAMQAADHFSMRRSLTSGLSTSTLLDAFHNLNC